MASIRTSEVIQKLTKTSVTTLQLPLGSRINIGGQQYNTLTSLTLNTATVGVGGVDVTVAAGSLYYVYAVISSGQVYLIASLNSSLPSGFTQARAVGGFTTDASSQIDQVGEYAGNLSVAGSVSAGGGLSVQPAQNFFINGGLDFWQRGVTSSSASWTYLTADRFITGNEGSTPVTAQYLDSPNANTKWCLRFTGNFAATNRVSFQQRIESSNAQYLVGKTITTSFWYKITAPNLDTTTANMTSIFLDIANTADNYTGTTNYGFQPLNIVADGTWRKASYVFTIPTSYSGAALANGFSVYIRLRKNATVSTDAWDVRFAQLMLNIGTSAAPFQRAGGTIGGELALCQRYCYGADGLGSAARSGYWQATGSTFDMWFYFPVPMRVAPTELITPLAANCAAYCYGTGSAYTCTAIGSAPYLATRDKCIVTGSIASSHGSLGTGLSLNITGGATNFIFGAEL